MNDNDHDILDDPLDQLLSAAQWPEMSPAARDRVESAWLDARPSIPAWPIWTWRAAAVLAVAVGVIWMNARTAHPIASVPPIKNQPPETRAAIIPSRPANAAEQLIALCGRSAPAAVATAQLPKATIPDQTEAARHGDIQALATLMVQSPREAVSLSLKYLMQKSPSSDHVLQAMKQNRSAIEEELFRRLDDPQMTVRLTAARALGYLDGPVVTRRLAAMVNENRNRREAIAALMFSDGPDARAIMQEARQARVLQNVIMSVQVQMRSF